MAGYAGEAVGPRNDGPTPGGRRLVRSEDHAGPCHIRSAGRARVIQNAECRHTLRKLVFLELRGTDQLHPPGREGADWESNRSL